MIRHCEGETPARCNLIVGEGLDCFGLRPRNDGDYLVGSRNDSGCYPFVGMISVFIDRSF